MATGNYYLNIGFYSLEIMCSKGGNNEKKKLFFFTWF